MSEPAKGKPGSARGLPPKDPFGPPLEPAHVREVFRRLASRSPAEQQKFVAKVNWNLIDPTVEAHLMAWLAGALNGPNRDFALGVLDKLPHPRRARHVDRFQAILPELPPATAQALQNAFGPVLGGMPKRPGAKAKAPEPKEASGDDLQRLKDFFDKFGGAR